MIDLHVEPQVVAQGDPLAVRTEGGRDLGQLQPMSDGTFRLLPAGDHPSESAASLTDGAERLARLAGLEGKVRANRHPRRRDR